MDPYFLTVMIYFATAEPHIARLQFNSLEQCMAHGEQVEKTKSWGVKGPSGEVPTRISTVCSRGTYHE